MTPKILRPCDICKRYHASYLVVDPQTGTRYYCYSCWKALKAQAGAANPESKPKSGPEEKKDR